MLVSEYIKSGFALLRKYISLLYIKRKTSEQFHQKNFMICPRLLKRNKTQKTIIVEQGMSFLDFNTCYRNSMFSRI